MKLLITGGTVFASRYTAEYFVKRGHDVYVLNRGSRPQPDGVKAMIADRRSPGSRLRSHSFDAVIDVTAYNAPDVSCLIDALGDFGCYILISSSAVYPETLPQPFREDMETGCNSVWGRYGMDKIAAEKEVSARTACSYILRPPYLCGPMNNLYREAFVFECAEYGRPFYLPQDGSMKLQFCHIGDMCRVIEAILIKAPREHIYNIGSPDTVTVREWVGLCYGTVGRTPEFINVDSSVPQRSYFPFYRYEYSLDVSLMLSLTGSVTPLEESIRSSYGWFRDHRELIVRKPLMDYIDSKLKGE